MSSPITPEVFTDITVDPFVRGLLHHPANATGDAILLTHGAGGNCNALLLIALAETFAAAGYLVLRCDLPFRQDRPYGPPGPFDGKRDRAGLKNALAALRPMAQRQIFLGGHSYGGRQSSIFCAEQHDAHPEKTAGLLLLSYPLHPPRKPQQLRTQHFPDLRTPALFIQGTRDPFGSIAELEQSLKLIPAKTRLVPVEGAGHDLGFKGKSRNEGVPKLALSEFQAFSGFISQASRGSRSEDPSHSRK